MSVTFGLFTKTNFIYIGETVLNLDAPDYGTGALKEIAFRGVVIDETVS